MEKTVKKKPRAERIWTGSQAFTYSRALRGGAADAAREFLRYWERDPEFSSADPQLAAAWAGRLAVGEEMFSEELFHDGFKVVFMERADPPRAELVDPSGKVVAVEELEPERMVHGYPYRRIVVGTLAWQYYASHGIELWAVPI